MRALFTAAILTLTFVFPAHAASTSLFGIVLGSKLTLPLCSKTQSASMCSTSDNAGNKFFHDGALHHLVYFAPATVPAYVSGNYFRISERAGVVQSIYVVTRGIPVQRDVFNLLVTKFGWSKNGLVVNDIQTAQGPAKEIEFKWTRRDGGVLFMGANVNSGLGAIAASTNAEMARTRAIGPSPAQL